MSYNGIGLSSAKGSGTSGFVQRTESKNETEDEGKLYLKRQLMAKKAEYNERQSRQFDLPIDNYLKVHEFEREREVKVSEYMDQLEDEGSYNSDQINELVIEFRKGLKQNPESYNVKVNPFNNE